MAALCAGMTRYWLTTGVFLLVLHAPVAEAAGLLHLFRDAQQSDPLYAAARAERNAADSLVAQARGQLLPQITANASRNHNDQSVDTATSRGDFSRKYGFNSVNASLNLTQPLIRPQSWFAYAQANAQVRQAESQFHNARQDLIIRLAQAYFDILLAEDTLTLSLEQKSAIAEQLKQARRFFEAGVGTVTDINEAQARFDTISAQEIAAQNNLEVKTRALEQIVGHYYPRISRLGSNPALELPEPADPDKWISFALAGNPLVAAREAALENAGHEVKKSYSAHLPTVDIVASRVYSENPGYTTIDTTSWNNVLGVQVSVPIFSGGATQGRADQASSLREKAQFDLEATRRAVTLSARQEYLNVVNGVAQIKALEQAVKSNETALYSARKGLEAGVRTSFDVLNAQQLLFSAKRDLALERYRYLLSRLRLRAAGGLLGEDDVVLVDRLLEPINRN